ncbi:MAG: 2-oxoglutarate dehydrogenase E1 component [Candidatus Binatia bacterium]|jgi:2-oxoglutarate dehydrogenase E1 component
MDLDFITRANPDYVDGLYRQFLRDPSSVDEQWAMFFAGFEAAEGDGARAAKLEIEIAPAGIARLEPAPSEPPATGIVPAAQWGLGVFELVHHYREFGHLIANLDPLGHNQSSHPLLEPKEFGFTAADLDRAVECTSFLGCRRATIRELVTLLRATYCGTFAVEYMDIADKAQLDWLQEHMEPALNKPELTAEARKHILSRLIAAEGFEHFLHTKYVGQKRFSLEGAESLIPLLDTLIEEAGKTGVEQIIMGMAHRGRLNVLANILHKPYALIFAEFEGTFLPPNVQGDGDVKYHLGYAYDHTTESGQTIHLSLCSNPSHLEAIDPVVEGIVRAKQYYLKDYERSRVVPVLIHGDAAFTGQGIVSETLALSELEAYRTGGTIHIIVNNQIGFTESPPEYRFTRYPSDITKIIQAPVFHINGDDPEAAIQAARLAVAFRQRFKKDVVIDLVCYRRHGHNEGDDPTFTQPLMYKEIAAHRSVRDLYAERLQSEGVIGAEEVAAAGTALREVFDDALNYARDFMPRMQVFALDGAWKGLQWAGDDWSAHTAVPREMLERVMQGLERVPQGFTVHPKVKRLLAQRAEMLGREGEIDWAGAEMLAFGTLLLEGTKIRLSGQDSGRGTFSQRHAELFDINTNERYVPLDHLSPEQGRFVVIGGMLSEEAVLGFEWGFSSADPRNLVVWEAQFGDFANNAQVIIDQFIASSESKWQRMSGIVLLLPHAYEGQGPEHSGARLERFMQLCAEDNMQICNLTTPAQYFHALRRQMHRQFRKPLIVMSPKSLLRHKLAVSSPHDLSDGSFQMVLGEGDPMDAAKVRRVLLCSGRVYYELLVARRERDIDDIAIVRVEQLYPFPGREITAALQPYVSAREVLWVQEEPWNMGAWHDMRRRLRRILPPGRFIGYAGRPAAASPATGLYKVHQTEETDLINNALRKSYVR